MNYQIQGFSLQLKNGWLEVLGLVALLLFKTGTCDTKNSFILKNANQKHNQHAYKQVRATLSYRRTIRLKQENFSCNNKTNYTRRHNLLLTKTTAVRSCQEAVMTSQIGDSLSALYLYSCVNFPKCLSVAY